MKLLIISAIIAILIVAGIAGTSMLKVDAASETAEKPATCCGSSGCTKDSNCGQSSCGAVQGKTCNCKK